MIEKHPEDWNWKQVPNSNFEITDGEHEEERSHIHCREVGEEDIANFQKPEKIKNGDGATTLRVRTNGKTDKLIAEQTKRLVIETFRRKLAKGTRILHKNKFKDCCRLSNLVIMY